MERSSRLAYLDNLRAFVIFLVVVMHSNVTYSGFGMWYYTEGSPQRLSLASELVFGLYGSFTQAWFMGCLFFVAGYFAARALERKGGAAFVRERLFRLGVPLLVYVFVLQPLIMYFLYHFGALMREMSLARWYGVYLTRGLFLGGTGPLWFVEVLLVFCLLYALVRFAVARKETRSPMPGTPRILGLVAATGLAAFFIRLVFPIGTAVANLQFCYFASYIVLFILGVHAGERGWLTEIPRRTGLRWFTVGLAVGIPAWLLLMGAGGASAGIASFNGGWHWQSAAFAVWEAFVALSLSIGMVVFFRTYFSREAPALATSSFGIYMFHPPVLIGISLALASWSAPLLAKHLVVAPLAWLAALAVALLLRRTPVVREIIR